MSSFQSYSATSLSASQTVANFNAVRGGHVLPKAGTNLAETNGAHNIGSATYKWDKGYIAGIASSVTVTAPVTFTSTPTFNTTTTIQIAGLPAMAVCKYVVAAGTGPQQGSSNAEIVQWTTITTNTIQGCSLTTNQISLPSGAYVFNAFVQFSINGSSDPQSIFYLFDATASTTAFHCGGPSSHTGTSSARYSELHITGRFSLLTQSSMELRVSHDTAYNSYFGSFNVLAQWNDGNTNVYQQIVFFKVS